MQRRFIQGDAKLLVLLADNEDLDKITEGLSCSVLIFYDFDWNRDLSPWPAEAVFKGEGFSGGADNALKEMLADSALKEKWEKIYICGYSMAGLFALYAAAKTSIFDGIASCSGSLWFDGFYAYLERNPVHAEKVYISVGDRESHSRNARMRTVVDISKKTAELISGYALVKFVLNPGTHFDDPEGRMRQGIAWLFSQSNER